MDDFWRVLLKAAVGVGGLFVRDICTLYIYIFFFSAGRKLALVEGLSHDLELAPDRFFMSTLRGRCGTVKLSPGFKFDKLRRYSQGEI